MSLSTAVEPSSFRPQRLLDAAVHYSARRLISGVTAGRRRARSLALLCALAGVCNAGEPRALAVDELAVIGASGSLTTLNVDMRGPNHRSVIVADGGAAELGIEHEVELTDAAQSSLRAGNLVNVAGADSASGINIYTGPSTMSALTTSAITEQSNEIVQEVVSSASAGRLELGGRAIREASVSGSSWQSALSVEIQSTLDRELGGWLERTAFSGSVETAPGEVLKFTPEPNPIEFGDIKITIIDAKTNDDEDLLSVRLRGGKLKLGDITMRDDAIVVGPSVFTLPTFVLEVKGKGLGDEESFSDPDINVPKVTIDLIANPLAAFKYGVGLAAVGTGATETEPGFLRLTVDIGLEDILRALTGKLKIPGTSIDVPWKDILDQLPSFRVTFRSPFDPYAPLATTLDESTPTCIGTVDECKLETQRIEYSEKDSSTFRSRATGYSSSEEYDRSYESHVRGSVQLEVEQANQVVVGESRLNAERYSIVLVEDRAQAGGRMLSGVNAANALIGNGLNLNTAHRQQAHSMQSQRMRQANSFVQVGGL